jgi:hypothetical protein
MRILDNGVPRFQADSDKLTTLTIAFDKPRGFILDMLNLRMQLCKVYVSNLSSLWEEHKSISCCFLRGKESCI